MTTQDIRLLLVEDTATLAFAYASHLRNEGLEVETVGTAADAMYAVTMRRYAAVILDMYLPDGHGLEILAHINEVSPDSSVIVVTADDSDETALEATRLGAWDFLVKPVAHARLVTTVRNALERTTLQSELSTIRRGLGRESFCGFVGSAPAMQVVYSAIENVAGSKATVFITGESGTGKEVCADAIHRSGPREGRPFIAINCGAIPGELMESELFGHMKGAFTGATTNRDGAASLASGGTLFLDEVCEMDLPLQTKLLRFLQTGAIQRVGSAKTEEVDVRVICATNRDPEQEVREGRFREDLYYRLNVIPIQLPPLRDRGEDVVRIATAFLERFAEEEGKAFRGFEADALLLLESYGWPGNVRELQNVMRRVIVMHDGEAITTEMLPDAVRGLAPPAAVREIPRSAPTVPLAPVPSAFRSSSTPSPGRDPDRGSWGQAQPASSMAAASADSRAPAGASLAWNARRDASYEAASPPPPAPTGLRVPMGVPLRILERQIIEAAIAHCGGSIPRAAGMLEVSPSTIYRKKESWDKQDAEASLP